MLVSCCALWDELKYWFADKYIWYLMVMGRGGKGKSNESAFFSEFDKQKPCSLLNPMATHQAEKDLLIAKVRNHKRAV